jgi:regulatory protein
MSTSSRRGAVPGDAEGVESGARSICLQLLTRRAHTQAELARALARRGVPEEVADRVLGRLTAVGLVNDAAVAASLVAARHRDRGWARGALGVELRRRGVDDADIRGALDTVTDRDEADRARALVARRLPATRGQPPEVRARRLVGMLARKGYPAGLASRVVRDALAAEARGDPDGADVADVTHQVTDE